MNTTVTAWSTQAPARGQLWVSSYALHYGPTQYGTDNPHELIGAALDMIEDALAYVDALTLEHHLPTDGSAQILEDLQRRRSSMKR